MVYGTQEFAKYPKILFCFCVLPPSDVCLPSTNKQQRLFFGDGTLYTHYCSLFKPFIVVERGSFFTLTTQFSLLLDMVCCYRLMIAITLTSLLLLRGIGFFLCNRGEKNLYILCF